MGFLQELINKMFNRDEESGEELPDEMTRDKYLRSLRRENRVMDEEVEKEYLRKKIALRKRIRLRKQMFGIRDNIQRQRESSFFGRNNL